MKLSICVITMNRAQQLKEALESCLACDLPPKTEFVIIDNASTDETEKTVKSVFDDRDCNWYYEKLSENLGVGGGRNYAYKKASGQYVYMLDDDAIIDISQNKYFFLRAVKMLDENSLVATLTTQIYDTAWGKNRVEIFGKEISSELYTCYMFCGGSHFLRKSFFGDDSPYLSNKYGYEELPPSLKVMEAGFVNAFGPNLLIIHKPIVDKWNYRDERNRSLLFNGIALPYAIKRQMYPKIFVLLLWIGFKRRCQKYLNHFPDAKEKTDFLVKEFSKIYKLEKISTSCVIRMIREFGLTVV